MIKRKKLSWSIGFFSLVLAVVWVLISVFGIVKENEKSGLKEVSGQKITYQIPMSNAKITKVVVVLDDDSGNLEIDKIIDFVPKNIIFGLSPYNNNIYKNIVSIAEKNRKFLVNLPISSNKKHNKRLDISQNMRDVEVANKVDTISQIMQGSSGFYSVGNDDFLKSEVAIEALVRKISDDNLPFIFGIKNKTSILELEDGANLKIGAFDLEIEDISDSKFDEQVVGFEDKSNNLVTVLLKIRDKSPERYKEFFDGLKDKNVEFVSIEQLWQKS